MIKVVNLGTKKYQMWALKYVERKNTFKTSTKRQSRYELLNTPTDTLLKQYSKQRQAYNKWLKRVNTKGLKTEAELTVGYYAGDDRYLPEVPTIKNLKKTQTGEVNKVQLVNLISYMQEALTVGSVTNLEKRYVDRVNQLAQVLDINTPEQLKILSETVKENYDIYKIMFAHTDKDSYSYMYKIVLNEVRNTLTNKTSLEEALERIDEEIRNYKEIKYDSKYKRS